MRVPSHNASPDKSTEEWAQIILCIYALVLLRLAVLLWVEKLIAIERLMNYLLSTWIYRKSYYTSKKNICLDKIKTKIVICIIIMQFEHQNQIYYLLFY